MSATTIDAYLVELDRALRGSKRLKADLLAEARDGLVDSAEAYEAAGMSAAEAQTRAVDEFGSVAEIAPRYQTELGLTQGRRTALLLFFALGGQHLLFEYTWSTYPAQDWAPGPTYAMFAELVDQLNLAILGCALVAALACGIGSRYARPSWLAGAVAKFALAVVAGLLIAGVGLGSFSPIDQFSAEPRYLVLHVAALSTLTLISRSAWRCAHSSRPTKGLSRTIVL